MGPTIARGVASRQEYKRLRRRRSSHHLGSGGLLDSKVPANGHVLQECEMMHRVAAVRSLHPPTFPRCGWIGDVTHVGAQRRYSSHAETGLAS